jgi:hypothetical protein
MSGGKSFRQPKDPIHNAQMQAWKMSAPQLRSLSLGIEPTGSGIPPEDLKSFLVQFS